MKTKQNWRMIIMGVSQSYSRSLERCGIVGPNPERIIAAEEDGFQHGAEWALDNLHRLLEATHDFGTGSTIAQRKDDSNTQNFNSPIAIIEVENENKTI